MRRERLFVEWLIIGLFASLMVVLAIYSAVAEQADRLVYDNVAPFHAPPVDDRIIIAEINDEALANLGRWPWPRSLHAQATERIKQQRPTLLLYDILFIEPSTDDAVLARAIAGKPPVFLPILFEIPGENGAPWHLRFPVDPIARSASGIGTANLSIDSDGMARSIVIATPDAQYGVIPHMAELAYRAVTGHPSPAFTRTQNDAQPLHIAFHPPGSFRTVSLLSILRNEVPDAFLRDKIVIIGGTAEGLGDIHPVTGRHANRMAGVEVQANLLSSLIADRFISFAPQWGVILLSLLPLWGLLIAFWRLSPARGLMLAIGVTVFIIAGSVLTLAIAGWWFPPTAALLGIAIVYPLWGWRRLAAVTDFMGTEVKALLAHTGIGDPAPQQGWNNDRVANDAGRLHQVIAIMQRNAEEREEMLQFLSHDMRSPQAAIIALLKSHPDAAKNPSLRDRILRYAEHTLRLADDFVQLARIQSRPSPNEPIDVSDALAQAADIIWSRAQAKHIQIIRNEQGSDTAQDEDYWPDLWINGDPGALVRAFTNLLSNAVQMSPEGSIITCEAIRDGDYVVVSVSDNGPGLPIERRDHPFARFGYSSPSNSAEGHGSGLGLAYIEAVAHYHGGTAHYTENPGGGACFSLRLPLE
ncbi:MAG: CHASE2 domain-containing protein [Sphingobium sp.]|nr:CHASE2 domain-containing protein [Sphingobium sp.]